MKKKEYYKHILPHFQQPGQAYFITWCLKDAVPPKALIRYTQKLELLKSQIKTTGAANSNSPVNNRDSEIATPKNPETEKLKQEYYAVRKKYIKAYNDFLDTNQKPTIDLSIPANTNIILNSLRFWENKKLKNFAITVMPNHVHWVMQLFDKDQNGKAVYLQDILYSVKRFTSSQINKAGKHCGAVWQKESFDTTIRDEKHLYHTITYTLNNPVKAGLVQDWRKWPGTWNGYPDF